MSKLYKRRECYSISFEKSLLGKMHSNTKNSTYWPKLKFFKVRMDSVGPEIVVLKPYKSYMTQWTVKNVQIHKKDEYGPEIV